MRRGAVLLLLVAACGGGTASTGGSASTSGAADPALPATAPAATTTAPAITTTPAATALGAGLAPAVLEAANAVVSAPSQLTLSAAAVAMHEDGDERWVPFLVDLMRIGGNEQVLAQVVRGLEEITGITATGDFGTDYIQYGRVLYDEEIDAGAEYVTWKAHLYGLIDAEFRRLIAQVEDPLVAARIQWGGVRRGGIPELNEPATIAAADAGHMEPDELTFGAVLNGEIRSYPHRILDHHELANDVLGGEPVALVNCTLCRTGVLYSRRVGDQVLDFETSGLLINSNKIMVDRQTETLWEQLTGVGLAGPLAGTELERHLLTVTTWGDWVEEHPDSDVVAIPADGPPSYSYEPGDAYAAYYASADVIFPVASVAEVFPAKTEVATIDRAGDRLAVAVDALADAGPQVLPLGSGYVAVVPTDGGARFYDAGTNAEIAGLIDGSAGEAELTLPDGSSLLRLQSGQSFWFAWYAAFPDTAWWPEG